MKIKLKFWFTFIIYLALNAEIGAAKPIKNHFVGHWTIDLDKTLFEDPSLSMPVNSEMFNLFQDNYKVKFSTESVKSIIILSTVIEKLPLFTSGVYT